MCLKCKRMKMQSGEIIELRFTRDGLNVCPVCGFIEGGYPAYSDECYSVDKSGKPFGEPSTCGSCEMCSCCETEYGLDDFPDSKVTTVKGKWEELRQKWLEKVGKTKEVIEQLKNIDIYLDEEE